MRKVLIVVAGPVGAGKSTQIRCLASHLRRVGKKVRVTYLKTVFILTRGLLSIFKSLGISKEGLQKVHQLAVTIDLTMNMFLLSLLALLRVRLTLKFFDYVLVEEYLPGTLVDYFHATKVLRLNQRLMLGLIKLILRLLYLPYFTTFIITCSPSLLPYRWRTRNSPQEIPSYLEAQNYIFTLWSMYVKNVFQFHTDDKSVKDTFREIKAILYSLESKKWEEGL
ncbi:MAG: hypothetical protein QW707_07295 [Candidatus Bathyarchaeia archaeon]